MLCVCRKEVLPTQRHSPYKTKKSSQSFNIKIFFFFKKITMMRMMKRDEDGDLFKRKIDMFKKTRTSDNFVFRDQIMNDARWYLLKIFFSMRELRIRHGSIHKSVIIITLKVYESESSLSWYDTPDLVVRWADQREKSRHHYRLKKEARPFIFLPPKNPY